MSVEMNEKEISVKGKRNNYNNFSHRLYPSIESHYNEVREELLSTLRLVKRVLDGSYYEEGFDELYDKVTTALKKYDNP